MEEKKLKYILTNKFSQDHLETLFSVIRRRGGFNNNPNCVQFMTIFKRILMRNVLQSSLNVNCLPDSTKILTSTSTDIINKSIQKILPLNQSQKEKKNIRTTPDKCDHEIDIEDCLEEVNMVSVLPETLSQYANDVNVHIAGCVERHIKKKIKCPD